MNYDPNKHHRRSIRLKGYDYSKKGLYFITLCCQDRSSFFGEIDNGENRLNKAGEIVKEEWEKTPLIRENTALHEYIIMPNHFHAIIEILFSKNHEENIGEFKSPSQTIGAIIRGFKGASTKRIKELYFSENQSTCESQFAPKHFSPTDKIWQRNYYESIIRNEKSYYNISRYIRNNPANWEKDKFNHR
ncbi:transposase [Salibacter halophilus]|uniref:Transposase IS200-like domain-containing protein n=1 Tax=Salibacter halophilus TaxID=1803916 RepID=A0A6N6M8K5_9FLAO|nr:transposase [Salibacter halophilus]KAB1064348.1 hypothetical protein F3059_06500 [Salibacter halophilus]